MALKLALEMRRFCISLFFLSSFLGDFPLGKCLYVSNQVSDSICKQHGKFTESGELQKPEKSGSGSDSACGWYQLRTGEDAGCAAARASFIECSTIEQRQRPSSEKLIEQDQETGSGRIVDGEDAERNEFPSIVIMKRDGDLQCGSTMISPEWVVTAAHCVGDFVKNEDFEVFAGYHLLNETDKDNPVIQRRRVVAYTVHEKYVITYFHDDIAVMKIFPPFELNDKIKAVVLPEPDYQPDGEFTIAGWGAIKYQGENLNALQKVQLSYVDDEACLKAYNQSSNFAKEMICAGPVVEGGISGGCNGDSGSPLYKIDGDKQTLVGITSWGKRCSGTPTVFTEVVYYVDWIKKNTCME